MIFIKKTLWIIFCLLPIFFISILYSLLIGKFARIEIVNNFLISKGFYTNLVAIAYILIFIYIPTNFLQLILSLIFVFNNSLKFNRSKFQILFLGITILLVLTTLWLTPYISITFFKNYQFPSFWHRQMYPLIYFLDITVPLGQLFFLYIFRQFWKIWFGKLKHN